MNRHFFSKNEVQMATRPMKRCLRSLTSRKIQKESLQVFAAPKFPMASIQKSKKESMLAGGQGALIQYPLGMDMNWYNQHEGESMENLRKSET